MLAEWYFKYTCDQPSWRGPSKRYLQLIQIDADFFRYQLLLVCIYEKLLISDIVL